METVVLMVVIAWMPQPDTTLKDVWRIEDRVPLRRCIQMQSIFAGGGSAAAITVRCGDFKTVDTASAPKVEDCSAFVAGFKAFFGHRC